jgi:hypothetical protein
MSIAVLRLAVTLLNPIVIALTGWLIAVFGLQWGFSRRLSAGLGVLYCWGTMALAYSHTQFSDPTLTLFITLAVYAVYRARGANATRWFGAAGSALGAALYLRERALIIVPLFIAYAVLTRRLRTIWQWVALLVPLTLGLLALGMWNWLRFGTPLMVGYAAGVPGTGFVTPLLMGLYGLSLSPGKGLLIYNPIAWLGLLGLVTLVRQRRAEGLFFTSLALAPLLFYASYTFWTGGWNWGPRYLLPLLPLLLLSAGEWFTAHPSRGRRNLLVALSVMTVALNLPAMLVDHSRYLVDFGERDPDHYLSRAIIRVEDAPVMQQWPTVLKLAALYTRPETWQAARQAIEQHLQNTNGSRDLDDLNTSMLWADEFFRLNTPDFWFVHLPLLGFSPFIVALVTFALLGVVIFSARKVWLMIK